MDRMRCRRLKLENGTHHVVWFGSYGVNLDGTAKFYNADNKHDNYGDEQQAVADSLTQRLSIIQEELWYAINYGLPLLEKNTSKLPIDAKIADIILAHPDVINIKTFDSNKNGRQYSAKIVVISKFGEVNLQI